VRHAVRPDPRAPALFCLLSWLAMLLSAGNVSKKKDAAPAHWRKLACAMLESAKRRKDV